MWSATRSRLNSACKIAMALSLLVPSASVQARPSSGNGLRAELDALGTQIAQLNEDHNSAKLRLAQVERETRDNEKIKEQAEARLTKLRGAASSRAAAMYRTGFPGILLVLFGSSDQAEFSRRVGAASRVGVWENGLLSRLEIANEDAEQRTKDLRDSLRKAKAIRDGLSAKRSVLKKRQAEQQNLLNRYLAAAEASRAAARRAASSEISARSPDAGRPAVSAVAPPVIGPNIQTKPIPVPATLSASGNARTALETAYAQTGKPYQWGASGPGSFDCSGLTMYAWRSAGVSLPHSSRAQYAATKRVERSDLKPGDLVFFGSPIHHVGMYVGDGKMINSPETGERVGVRSMNRRDYAGAGRPGV